MAWLFTKRSTSMVTVDAHSRFTNRADIQTNHCTAAINVEGEAPITLILANNLTVNVTKNIIAEEIGGMYVGIKSSTVTWLNANTAAKTITATARFTSDNIELTSACGILVKDLMIGASTTFLYTIRATASNNKTALAYGIACTGKLESDALIAKPITVQARTTKYGAPAWATGISTNDNTNFYSGIGGDITATATAAKGGGKALGLAVYGNLTIYNKLAGRITVNCTGSQHSEGIVASAVAIQCTNNSQGGECKLYNISKAISATSRNSGAAESFAIQANSLGIFGKNAAAVTVRATSTHDKALAQGFTAGALVISVWKGNFTVTAQGETTEAAIFTGETLCSFGDINGNLSVTATSTAGDAEAIGFHTGAMLEFINISKTKLTVKASSSQSKAYAAGMYSTANGLTLHGAELNIGQITVSATSRKQDAAFAYGIALQGAITATSKLGTMLEGKITVTATNGTAYGILAQKLDVVSNLQLSVKGTTASCAYYLDGTVDSKLEISNATVKAEVTNRLYKNQAYAVYMSEGTGNNNVVVDGSSKITGAVSLAGGTDSIYLRTGAYFKGYLDEVEKVTIALNDSNRRKQSWDIVASDEADAAELDIAIDYGLTGSFLICTKETNMAWTDAIENKINMVVGGALYEDVFSVAYGGMYEDQFFKFELEFKGNKMFLNVSEKLA